VELQVSRLGDVFTLTTGPIGEIRPFLGRSLKISLRVDDKQIQRGLNSSQSIINRSGEDGGADLIEAIVGDD
jgi:hypothetical protein